MTIELSEEARKSAEYRLLFTKECDDRNFSFETLSRVAKIYSKHKGECEKFTKEIMYPLLIQCKSEAEFLDRIVILEK